jgi:hypothetical protein
MQCLWEKEVSGGCVLRVPVANPKIDYNIGIDEARTIQEATFVCRCASSYGKSSTLLTDPTPNET